MASGSCPIWGLLHYSDRQTRLALESLWVSRVWIVGQSSNNTHQKETGSGTDWVLALPVIWGCVIVSDALSSCKWGSPGSMQQLKKGVEGQREDITHTFFWVFFFFLKQDNTHKVLSRRHSWWSSAYRLAYLLPRSSSQKSIRLQTLDALTLKYVLTCTSL